MKTFISFALALTTFAAAAFAQTPAPAAGTLVVTVVDSTGAVLPGATVTVTGIEAANKAIAIEPVKATEQGVATIPKIAAGRYSIRADFAGFETRMLPDVRVRSGNNKQVVMLPIEGHKETVLVGQDKQAAAADPRGASFGTQLTREQLANLSDDPQVLQQQLMDMAGPGAIIRVDSFEGAALPNKSQIRSIRISRDQFAAEFHEAGGINVEIITQPGMGPMRMNAQYRLLGDSLSGRSPFVPQRGPEDNRNLGVGGGGTLIKNKSSFNFFINDVHGSQTPNINIVTPDGEHRSEAMAVQSQNDGFNGNANIDYALTIDQTLRFGLSYNSVKNENQGIGGWDREDRGYTRDQNNGQFTVQQIGPLGRRAFLRTRVRYSWNTTENGGAIDVPTVRVIDAFTVGGAQVAGGQRSKTVTLGSDFDYVRGNHTLRVGTQIDAADWHSDDHSNYLGTYTFESLAAYEAGTPRSYTRRIGNPNIDYNYFQGAIYTQDDFRIRRNLTLSGGVRYEAQNHVGDLDNVMPRLGVTWAPGTAGTTTLRASWGIFTQWMPTSTYEQTLRVDGERQKEIDLANPAYPIITDVSSLTAAPVSKYQLSDDLALPRLNRASLGIDRRYKTIQASATYSFIRGGAVMRGDNLNAPINGVRPDARYANVVEVVSDGSSRQHQLQTNLTVNQGALFPLNKSAPRFSLKRVTLFLNYTLAKNRNNSNGAFAVPAFGNIDLDWGPTNNDVRHRLNATLNNQVIKNLQVGLGFNTTSASPYTLLSGLDDNRDLIFNDRPAGVARNTERGDGQLNMNLNVNYSWTFGPPAGGPPPIGVFVGGAGAAPEVRTFDQPARFRIGIFLFANNLTNHANYVGYSGVITSPFFRQATAVSGTRRVEAGLNFGF
ncbi:MAG TPA: TonB-dependent receptor [Vicinamibacterales bacterium]|nr:TonB-dependent receptor [Vicinamibacterales bacterium]